MSSSFIHQKHTFLSKFDKSKKGTIDERIKPLIETINSYLAYYTTSSCSGRVVLWTGSGKKNEMEWLNVSHDLLRDDFFRIEPARLLKIEPADGLVWLRVEPLILHIRCKDLPAAITILDAMKPSFKKSCLLTVRNKIIVEIRGSEFLEMPLFHQGTILWNGSLPLLQDIINTKMKKIFSSVVKLEKAISSLPEQPSLG